jgi:hypothetical protein
MRVIHYTMSRALVLFLLALTTAGAQEYWHRVTAGFHGYNAASGPALAGFGTAPALSFDYGFRFHRNGQFDMGVDTAFTSQNGFRRNVYVPRVGYRIVVPLWDDRIEASLGFGGAYAYYKPTIAENETWLVYGQTGVNYAIDPDKRYRAGVSIRWLRDPIGRPQQQWVSFGGEVSYSWGR